MFKCCVSLLILLRSACFCFILLENLALSIADKADHIKVIKSCFLYHVCLKDAQLTGLSIVPVCFNLLCMLSVILQYD